MHQLARVHVLERFEQLINDKVLMDLLENVSPDDEMKLYIFLLRPLSMKSKRDRDPCYSMS
jgi:hypothetical protein